MAQWSLDDIAWHAFDKSKVKPELLSIVKAASMVEHNGYDYARYLCEVFSDDKNFQQVAREWAEEEVQHGRALAKWAQLADPEFNFEQSFKAFTDGYKLPLNVGASVRGSRSGELIARCVVESGTSSYYTALKESTDEPVLKAICAKIAADELRHYKLFYTHLGTYLQKEKIGTLGRLKVALSRIAESEDDELAYAFFAANNPGQAAYNRRFNTNLYFANVCLIYKRHHIEKMAAMVFKAAGLKPHTLFYRAMSQLAWRMMQFRGWRLRKYLPSQELAAQAA